MFSFALGKYFSDLCFNASGDRFYSVSGKTFTQYKTSTFEQINTFDASNTVSRIFYYNGRLAALEANSSGVYSIERLNPNAVAQPEALVPSTTQLTKTNNLISTDITNIVCSEFSEQTKELLLLTSSYIYKINMNTLAQTRIRVPYNATKLSIYNNTVFVGSGSQGAVCLYDLSTLNFVKTIFTNDLFVGMQVGNDGYLYTGETGSWETARCGFNVETGARVERVSNTYGRANYMKSPVGNEFYYIDSWGDLTKRTYANGIITNTLGMGDFSGSLLNISPDGKYIYTAGGTIYALNDARTSISMYFNLMQSVTSVVVDSAHDRFYTAKSSGEILQYLNSTHTILDKWQLTGNIINLFYNNNNLIAITNDANNKISVTVFNPDGYYTEDHLSKLELTPAFFFVEKGEFVPITVKAIYDDGVSKNVTLTASISAADGSIATVNNVGTLNCLNYGTTQITASYQGKSVTANLTALPKVDISTSIGYMLPTDALFHFKNILPWGSTQASVITAVAKNSANNVTIVNTDIANGVCKVIVTTPDNKFTSTYYVSMVADEVLESEHNYANSLDKTYIYKSKSKVSSVSLTFSELTSFEKGYDYLYITDANGKNIIGSPFTGYDLAGKTVTVARDEVRLRLVTDEYTNSYGFLVDNISLNDSKIELLDSENKQLLSLPPSGEIKATGSMFEGKPGQMLVLWIVSYDATGKLISTAMDKKVADKNGYCTFNTGITIGSNVCSVKSSIWAYNTLQPLTSVFELSNTK